MVAHSQCVRARCLLVGVPVVLRDGLGFAFVFSTVHMGVVVAVGGRGRGRGRRLPSSWPLRMVPINKDIVLMWSQTGCNDEDDVEAPCCCRLSVRPIVSQSKCHRSGDYPGFDRSRNGLRLRR